MTENDYLIDDYLRLLKRHLRPVRLAQRRSYAASIRSHIEEALALRDRPRASDVREILSELGDPRDLAEKVRGDLIAAQKNNFRRNMVLAICVFVLLDVVAAALVQRATYKPVIRSSGTGIQVVGSNGKIVQPIGDLASFGGTTGPLWVEPHGTFEVEILTTLFNSGDFGIKLDRIEELGQSGSVRDTFRFGDGSNQDFAGTGPFEATEIPAHGDLSIEVRIPSRCEPGTANESFGYGELGVEYSYWGDHHVQYVSIPSATFNYRKQC